MTQDEIIEMAKEAGIDIGMWEKLSDDDDVFGYGIDGTHENLEAFAKLIAEKEREACAEVCKKHADVYAGLEQNPTTQSAWAACIDTRDAIRARGQA